QIATKALGVVLKKNPSAVLPHQKERTSISQVCATPVPMLFKADIHSPLGDAPSVLNLLVGLAAGGGSLSTRQGCPQHKHSYSDVLLHGVPLPGRCYDFAFLSS